MEEKWGPICFGAVFVLVGAAIGYAFYAYPSGFAEGWSPVAAAFVPLAFVAGGVLMIAHALGSMRAVGLAAKALALCLVVVINWATFFTPHVECVHTFAAFGVPLLSRTPSLEVCKLELYILVGTLDAVIVLGVAWYLLWRKGRAPSP